MTVPATSNNPTDDRDVPYVDITASFQGDSMIIIEQVAPTTSTCIDSTGTTVTSVSTEGTLAGVTLLNIRCSFVLTATSAGDFFDFQVTQTPSGASSIQYEYTMDFKVDGETVRDLSGTMQPVEGDTFGGTAGQRNFSLPTMMELILPTRLSAWSSNLHRMGTLLWFS